MRIFGTKPEDNDAAEKENARYIILAIEEINKSNEWLKNTDKPYQVMLTHIDILLMLARKFPVNANLLIKQYRTKEWKETFNEWFNRCEKKIPSKYREGIKANADELFTELEEYGNNLRY
ncbi:hypothetical protein [Lysinibacillus sp. G4S2]|uniref:hypothetical protein n=1 Tax=Lysinibacillus sp. G4S2 TaxID=3055859 RepID=UPI0025A0919D|nr:hypothetical protein [Lysinibacillus sp. G4S2]MDM5248714.1 hypothetical protein [Lysinibacillus sp. G4S2]